MSKFKTRDHFHEQVRHERTGSLTAAAQVEGLDRRDVNDYRFIIGQFFDEDESNEIIRISNVLALTERARDPRRDPEDSAETVTVHNPEGVEFDSNDKKYVLAAYVYESHVYGEAPNETRVDWRLVNVAGAGEEYRLVRGLTYYDYPGPDWNPGDNPPAWIFLDPTHDLTENARFPSEVVPLPVDLIWPIPQPETGPINDPDDRTPWLPRDSDFMAIYNENNDELAQYPKWQANTEINNDDEVWHVDPADDLPKLWVWQGGDGSDTGDTFDPNAAGWASNPRRLMTGWENMPTGSGTSNPLEFRLVRGVASTDYDSETSPNTFFNIIGLVNLTENSKAPEEDPLQVEAIFPQKHIGGDRVMAIYNPDSDEARQLPKWVSGMEVNGGDVVQHPDPANEDAATKWTWIGPDGQTSTTAPNLDTNWRNDGRLLTGWENMPSGSTSPIETQTKLIELKDYLNVSAPGPVAVYGLREDLRREEEFLARDRLGHLTGWGASDLAEPPSNPSSGRGTYGYAIRRNRIEDGESEWLLFSLDAYPQLVVAVADSDGAQTNGVVVDEAISDNHSTTIPNLIIQMVDTSTVLPGPFRGGEKYLLRLVDATAGPPRYQVISAMPPAGCGLEYKSGELAVDPTDLVSLGLKETENPDDCRMQVDPGCGLTFDQNQLIFNPDTAVDGTTLKRKNPAPDCMIQVNFGCGLTDDGTNLVVDAATLAGQGLEVVDTCTLDLYIGCGLRFGIGTGNEGKLEVDPNQLWGNGLTPAGDGCKLAVLPGCGITVSDGTTSVDGSQLAGDGLKDNGACQLSVDYDCGLTIVAGQLRVFPSDLAGEGLTVGTGTCNLDVNWGCGLIVDTDELLKFYAKDAAGYGLVERGETGSDICTLDVDPGAGIKLDATDSNKVAVDYECGLTVGVGGSDAKLRVNAKDLAGEGLLEDPSPDSCKLDVQSGDGIAIVLDKVTVDYACGLKFDQNGKLRIDDGIFGANLTWNEGACRVDAEAGGGGPTYTEGCGITISADTISFKPGDAAGAGLVANTSLGACYLEASIGCGLMFNPDSSTPTASIQVNAAHLAGKGIKPTTPENQYACELELAIDDYGLAFEGDVLKLNVGCGLNYGSLNELKWDADHIVQQSENTLERETNGTTDTCGIRVKYDHIIKAFEDCDLYFDGNGQLTLKITYKEYKIAGEVWSENPVDCIKKVPGYVCPP